MKRILKVTTVIAFLLTASVSMAKDLEVRLSATKEAKSLVLTLENASKELTVQFTDQDENILYFEKLKDGTLNKKFDLQNLQTGTYYLTTSDTRKLIVYTVSLDRDEVAILKKEEVLKPHFRKTKEKVFVNFLNLDGSKVEIKVYDDEYRVVFSETFTETMIVEKAFNFESAYAGNYKVVVSDANKSYSEYFIVD